MVNALANIIGEDLVSGLVDKLVKTVKLHAGYIVVQNLVVVIVNYLQNELGPVMAFMIGTFLTGTLPPALTDAVTTAVTNLLLPKLTTALADPVMNYYYCIYCYYYGATSTLSLTHTIAGTGAPSRDRTRRRFLHQLLLRQRSHVDR
jgi:hypothetical protein